MLQGSRRRKIQWATPPFLLIILNPKLNPYFNKKPVCEVQFTAARCIWTSRCAQQQPCVMRAEKPRCDSLLLLLPGVQVSQFYGLSAKTALETESLWQNHPCLCAKLKFPQGFYDLRCVVNIYLLHVFNLLYICILFTAAFRMFHGKEGKRNPNK